MRRLHPNESVCHGSEYYASLTRVHETRLLDRGWKPGDELPTASGPCEWCLGGQPERCTGVGCYRCTCGCRDRMPGVGCPVAGPMRGGAL